MIYSEGISVYYLSILNCIGRYPILINDVLEIFGIGQ